MITVETGRRLVTPTQLLVALALVHGALYAFLIPPWQAPDEIAHFEYSRLLAEHGRPLTDTDQSPALEQEIIQSLYTFDAYHLVRRPAPPIMPDQIGALPFFGGSRTFPTRWSLAYVPYALAIVPFLHADVLTQLYLMRLISVVLGAMVVGLAYQTARRLAPETPELAVGAALFLILLPQHAFILASVNDGNLAELLASAALYALARLLTVGFSWPMVGLAAACSLGAVASKATAYYLIPVVLLAAGPALWRFSRRSQLPVPRAALIGLGIAVIILVGAASIWLWNTALPRYLWGEGFQSVVTGQTSGLDVPGQTGDVLWMLFKSSWVSFGWLTLFLPEWVYVGLAVLSCLAGFGWLAYGGLGRFQGDPPLRRLIGMAALFTVAIPLAGILFFPRGTGYQQGRYLFGGIVPLTMLWVGGWLAQSRDRLRGLMLLIVVMTLLDAGALFGLAVPYFYAG